MVIADTDLVVGVLRGNPDAIAKFTTLEAPCITSITAFELLRGAYASSNPARERVRMIDVIDSMFVIDFSYFDADAAGRIDVLLARSGTPIGTLDTMIAAICITTKLPFITRNTKHFTRIPGLRVESW